MDRFYFIPTSSLNFNNILSSESISPHSFYEKRGYGFKRFEKVVSNSLSNSFLAYSIIPRVPILITEREEFLIYLAVPESYFKSYKTIERGHFQILQIDRPIYINPIECFFLVRTDEERRKLIAGSKKSLEVKHADLYCEKVFLLDEYHLDSFAWDDNVLEGIADLKSIKPEVLEEDKKFNKLKGLIYGYVAGATMNQPKEIIEGKRYFQRFINVFSSLLNDLSVMAAGKSKQLPNKNKLEAQVSELIDLQGKIATLFRGNESIEINEVISRDFSIDKEVLKSFEKLRYKNSQESVLTILSKFIKEKEPNYYSIGELLGRLITQIKQFIRYSNPQSYERLENDFSSISNVVNSKISTFKSDHGSTEKFKVLPFSIVGDFELKVQDTILSKDEQLIFELIINDLLSWTEVSSQDEIAQIRTELIQSVGKKIKETVGKESTPELEYLRRLFQSLKTIGTGFRPDESGYITLQSLACFLNRYSELEKLQDFMEKNGVRIFNYAYTYWGAAYGYANLSKLLISSISQNPELFKVINSFFEKTTGVKGNRHDLVSEFLFKYKGEKPIVVELKPVIPSKLETPKIPGSNSNPELQEKKSFEQVLRSQKELANKEDLIIQLVNISIQAIKNSENPEMFSFPKNKTSEFRDILKSNSKKMKGIGPKGIEFITSLFESYYGHE
ncbi:hypothetical protein DFQ04_3079 [Algoriphagus boseongensis]|uniref:Uncharacterized protein n=1 Tax=Algoriphagus boseongensis TaxID=1442587 RepID=A0A4R6T3B8_9BACT|nr:hypothetical protein [Algoriphagus boseongensis]TDQ15193.1 hypothetical protein DFQ04_3079 [Algoriphagus boseongensis]